jgi:aspartate carbamoyltransferase catalytic subunit
MAGIGQERMKAVISEEVEGSVDLFSVLEPIDGDPSGKHLLSMRQLNPDDIISYINEATAAERVIDNPSRNGLALLPFVAMKAVMRQPSTRTGGSMTTAMAKLSGSHELISGMSASSEAKGESLADSWLAFATQADILGIRTAEDYGPMLAAQVIDNAVADGKLKRRKQVINLGDGKNEHITQGLGDLYTIKKHLGELKGARALVAGDWERYRAFHSFALGAVAMGMEVVAVESSAAQVPEELAAELGDKLVRVKTEDFDAELAKTNVLYMGRRPDEFTDLENPAEVTRSEQVAAYFEEIAMDYERLQQMPTDSIGMHPRPRRDELHPDIDKDHRMVDVGQMELMIPMRMAILAGTRGKSIIQYEKNRRRQIKMKPWRWGELKQAA